MEATSAASSPKQSWKIELPLTSAFWTSGVLSDFVEYAVVDAFTDEAFKGNPAVVVLLPHAKDEKWMQQVAAEFNISVAAFLVKSKKSDEAQFSVLADDGIRVNGGKSTDSGLQVNKVDEDNGYHIRWFTPTSEIDLCGHATLASAHVVFSTNLVVGDTIIFSSKSGNLITRRIDSDLSQKTNDDLEKVGRSSVLELDFPLIRVWPSDRSEIKNLSTTLKGVEVIFVGRSGSDDLILELSSTEDVLNLQPQMHELVQIRGRGFQVTSKDCSESNIDFVTRSFFPKLGVQEDPVCGSAHCALAFYWGEKLRKNSLEAHQVSKRGGRLSLQRDLQSGRVRLRGGGLIVMTGVLRG